jgi:ankyrin repeat protein
MKYGADLNAQDINGDTPLNVMIDFLWSRDPSWFTDTILVPYGNKIDPTKKNKRGETTLGYAIAHKCLPIVKALCATGKWTCTEEERTGFVE